MSGNLTRAYIMHFDKTTISITIDFVQSSVIENHDHIQDTDTKIIPTYFKLCLTRYIYFFLMWDIQEKHAFDTKLFLAQSYFKLMVIFSIMLFLAKSYFSSFLVVDILFCDVCVASSVTSGFVRQPFAQSPEIGLRSPLGICRWVTWCFDLVAQALCLCELLISLATVFLQWPLGSALLVLLAASRFDLPLPLWEEATWRWMSMLMWSYWSRLWSM